MNGIGGRTDLQLKYSNLSAGNVSGKITGTLSKSDVDIVDCEADTELSMNYGTLNASLSDKCKTVRIIGSRAEIHLQTPTKEYNLELKTNYNDIEVFGNMVKEQYRWMSNTSSKTIFATTTYCPIKINLR